MKKPRNSPSLEEQIRGLIGDHLAFQFFNAFAGRRLYISTERNLATKIAAVIGDDAAAVLAEVWWRDFLRVPLAREFRYEMYRQAGLSNGEIATKLGITESAVNRMARRKAMPPAGENRRRDGVSP